MKILDRYVLRELVGPFAFGFALFITALVSGEYLFKLAVYISRGAPFLPVAELFLLRVVTQSVIAMPIATLMAMLVTFGRFSSESELVAMQAGGISVGRIARAAIGFGLAVSVAALLMNEFVIPPAGKQSRKLDDMIVAGIRNELVAGVGGGKAYVIQDFDRRQLSRVVIAREFNPTSGVLRHVTYLQFDQGRLKGVVEADEARWVSGNEWKFLNTRFTAVGPVSGNRTARMEDVPEARILTLNKNPGQIMKDMRKPEEMSFRELREYIATMRANEAPRRAIRSLEVGLANKLSLPFASLVFAFLGVPLGIRRHRSGAAIGVGMSVVVMFLYYLVWHGMTIVGENGQAPPVVTAWTANLVAAAIGLALLRRSGR